jgi:hypothetical protein
LSNRAKIFIGLITLSGTAVLVQAVAQHHVEQVTGLLALLIVSVVSSRLRLKLPGLTGTMSVNLPFILVAIAALNASESMVVGCLSTLTQSLPARRKKLNKIQAVFNVCSMALAIAATRLIYESPVLPASVSSPSLRLLVATGAFFVANSMPVAVVISLTENSHPLWVWAEMFQLSFPYYVASAGIAATVLGMSDRIGWWQPTVMLLIVVAMLHSYRRYFSASVASVQSKAATQAN